MTTVLAFMQCSTITAYIWALISNNGSTTISDDVIWVFQFGAFGASSLIDLNASW
jgi:hypothetical protein